MNGLYAFTEVLGLAGLTVACEAEAHAASKRIMYGRESRWNILGPKQDALGRRLGLVADPDDQIALDGALLKAAGREPRVVVIPATVASAPSGAVIKAGDSVKMKVTLDPETGPKYALVPDLERLQGVSHEGLDAPPPIEDPKLFRQYAKLPRFDSAAWIPESKSRFARRKRVKLVDWRRS